MNALVRHAQAFKDALAAERARVPHPADLDTAFLPAAIEIERSPPSPAGRAVAWTIMALATAALVWSCLARIDTVAVAEGRLVPAGRLRTVEAADGGTIRSIEVREGQRVTKDQVLVTLDPTIAQADAQSARSELHGAALTRARDNALLAYAAGRDASLQAPPDTTRAASAAERLLVRSRISEYEAKQASLGARREAAEAAAAASQAQVRKLEATLPLLEQQLQAQQALVAKGFGAKLRVLQEQERYIGSVHELQAERSRHAEAAAQVVALSNDMDEARQAFIERTAGELSQAEQVVATRGDAVRKADQRMALQTLRAPVSGVVQSVVVTTIGQVPEVGKPLVTIVPDTEDLVVEALVLNRDAAFVRIGDAVIVKLDAYPFTRHGTLRGVVERISPDATVDETRGLVFPARIRLTRRTLRAEGRGAALSAGMSGSVEIVTGRRRVIEFLWSPIAKAASEAGRER